jgi:hypothetical protein
VPDPSTPQASFVRRPGVRYALTAQNLEIPVIDVSHPAFAVADDAQTVEALRRTSALMMRRNARLPHFLLRFLIGLSARRSFLAREMLDGGNRSYLPGISTYLMKLGPDNLVPPFDGRADRRFAAYPGILGIRIRLQQTARLLAEGLEAMLPGQPGAALHLLNIGGGSAIDSLNALILLRRAAPALLQRTVVIRVLDPDANGPLFAARALAALAADGAPLAGVDARLVHTAYDWNHSAPLQQLVQSLIADGAVIAASSEGALFEYASDASLVANLQALHNDGAGARLVVGSVTRADELTRAGLRFAPFKLMPRGLAVFGELVRGTGFRIERVYESLASDQVLLCPENRA